MSAAARKAVSERMKILGGAAEEEGVTSGELPVPANLAKSTIRVRPAPVRFWQWEAFGPMENIERGPLAGIIATQTLSITGGLDAGWTLFPGHAYGRHSRVGRLLLGAGGVPHGRRPAVGLVQRAGRDDGLVG